MKKALNYLTLKAIGRRSSELAVKMDRKAAKRHALSAGLIEQATSANTELERINADANYKANYHTKSYAILDEWHESFRRDTSDVVDEIWTREFLYDEPFTVGEYLELVARKAPSEENAFPNFDNVILA